jgi:phosphoinositide-3-kinase, regulatory subunit 4
MGQGYSLTTLSAGSASIDIPELADLIHEKVLGTARFMKSIRARNQQGLVFVKAFVKPYPSFDLRKYLDVIIKERNALIDVPNALPYQRILETANGGFLARQYIHSSIYDRMSTRPFLEDIEKKWMAFQLLCAVRDCHARDVFHGDIKSENLLVTSWNWLYLADFSSSFKPAYLPEDNPADFSFYFDTSGRRTCYLAPERFIGTGDSQTEVGINWAMDIFSTGCVIAEIFLEGPIFTLSQLFRYRKGEVSLEHTHLNKLEDNDVRELILHMIRIEPESRYAAEEILTFWRGKVFPEYFYGFLHQYMALLTDSSSGRKPVSFDNNAVESDERIERIYADFDKISYFLGYGKQSERQESAVPRNISDRGMPVHVKIMHESTKNAEMQDQTDTGTLIFLAVIVSSLRSTSKAAARVKACDLLLALGQRLPDETKLDRILPYIVVLLSDDSDMVRIAALRTMTQLLAMVQVVSPVNAYIFPEYIFPRLKAFMLSASHQPSPIIRATYASCLASLAQSSARILDMMQAIKADGRLPDLAENDWASEATFHGLFDVARIDLVSHFEDATKALITDSDSSVRRAFLGSVSSLCVFFGSSKASDVILSHLNTYLNDQDWILKCSFIEVLVGVAAFVGVANLEKFILPLMIQSLTDPESFVVERVIRSLASIAEIGLLQKSTLWEVLSIVVRFLVHPSLWIREASAHFVACCGKHVSAADRYCIVLPLLHPFLRTPLLEATEHQILDSLKRPLQKPVLDMAMLWATKVEKGLFWKNAIHDAVFVSPEADSANRSIPSFRQFSSRISSSQRNEEDEQWLAKLRGLGMRTDDEVKLLALKEFIWRVAHRKIDAVDSTLQGTLNSVVPLNQINVTPQNIFFDNKEPLREIKDRSRQREDNAGAAGKPHTIADALLDASTTIDDSNTRRTSSINEPAQQGIFDSTRPKQIVKPTRTLDPGHSPSPYSSSANQTDSRGSPSRQPAYDKNKPTRTWPREAGDIEGVSSSSPRQKLTIRKASDNSLRHRSSAINLLNRKDTSKADAATSTTSENAFGKLDGPLQPHRATELSPLSLAAAASKSPPPKSPQSRPADLTYEPNHSYNGNDQNILRLLDNHFLENFPTDLFDFGQSKQSIDPRSSIPRVTDSSQLEYGASVPEHPISHSEPWHPSGHLLTLFSEHSAAVNCVIPSPDHAFFATASDDGTCRIWDTTRLEKNVTPRSRQTYKHPASAKVKALCFVENTHAFISGANDGSVHVVKVDYKKVDGGESTRYGKLSVVRDYQIPQNQNQALNGTSKQGRPSKRAPEYAICMHHYRTSTSQSVLHVLTSSSRLLAIDLKTMDILYTLTAPLAHGSPTTFVVDKRHQWLLLGTSQGIFDLWDLRFRLHIRSWGLKSGHRIQKICPHPTKGRGKWVIVAAGPEISVWDIEKPICKEVYRPDSASTHGPPAPSEASIARAATIASTKPYEPWFPDDETPEKLLSRFADHVSENGAITDPTQMSSPSDPQSRARSSRSSTASENAITALCVGHDNIHNPSSPQEPVKAPFFISGGSDRKLRFWDFMRPEHSSIISGMQPSADDGFKALKPQYEVTHPGGQMTLVTESWPSSTTAATTPGVQATTTPRKGGSKASNASSGASSSAGHKPPRSTIISKQQQMLLRNHLDGITDCCVLARPYGVVVSVDRGGGVYVFQ